MAKIEIYTTPFCGYCARAKGLLVSAVLIPGPSKELYQEYI